MSNFSNYHPGLTLPIVSFVMNTETTVTVVFAKYYNTVTLCQKYYNIETDNREKLLLQKIL